MIELHHIRGLSLKPRAGQTLDVRRGLKTYDLDVDAMSEEEQTEWANDVMWDSDSVAKALDIMGWKIVCKDEPDRRWPFGCGTTGSDCPEWCEDLSSHERKPDLRLVN